MEKIDRKDLTTEKQNIYSLDIDSKSISEILEIINQEDQSVADKVKNIIPQVAAAVEITTAAINRGNSIVYLGAGTSGRLGVLDASEIPPTFSASKNWFKAIIAGGDRALRESIEGAEDKTEQASADLKEFGLKSGDVLIGISTSGAAAYVRAGLDYGKSIHAKTIYLICNPRPYLEVNSDLTISVDVGPEVITGSTRMKSGTATKMILNMISTATMIRLGKVYGNLMVDLMAVNSKLVDRGSRIIVQLTGITKAQAHKKLLEADMSVKLAVVMIKNNCSREDAQKKLSKVNGFLRKIIDF